jgi:hypothetical protein
LKVYSGFFLCIIYTRYHFLNNNYICGMIDFIGDIHGYADKLQELLIKMDYTLTINGYAHPTRKVVFIGDYIDRGPQIRETLAIVKAMVDNGNATALMGNHEYNAICYHLQNKTGGHLREHSIKNMIQHAETIKQFQNNQQEYDAYIDWFLTLPLYLETDTYKAVHACWDNKAISYLQTILVNNRLTKDLVYKSVQKQSLLHIAIEQTLKGKEMTMPNGLFFTDKDGATRSEIRIKWWENPVTNTYKSISIEPIDSLPNEVINMDDLPKTDYYTLDDKKVFFGHYWLKGLPLLYKNNICCLDYSVAKGGKLVAYRLGNEQELQTENFVYV